MKTRISPGHRRENAAANHSLDSPGQIYINVSTGLQALATSAMQNF